jgi:hypothetical protein
MVVSARPAIKAPVAATVRREDAEMPVFEKAPKATV